MYTSFNEDERPAETQDAKNRESTANERLHILQMIEDGKVTPEQGTNLLAALGFIPQTRTTIRHR